MLWNSWYSSRWIQVHPYRHYLDPYLHFALFPWSSQSTNPISYSWFTLSETISWSTQLTTALRFLVLHFKTSTTFGWVDPWLMWDDHRSLVRGLDLFALAPIPSCIVDCRLVLDDASCIVHSRCACTLALFCHRWWRWIQDRRSSVLILCNRGHWVNLFSRSVGWAPALRRVFHRYRLEWWGLVLGTLGLGGSSDCSPSRWLAFGFITMANSRRSVALDSIHDFCYCFYDLMIYVPSSFLSHHYYCFHCSCSDVTWIWSALNCHFGLHISCGLSSCHFFHFWLYNDYSHHLEEKWPSSGLLNQLTSSNTVMTFSFQIPDPSSITALVSWASISVAHLSSPLLRCIQKKSFAVSPASFISFPQNCHFHSDFRSNLARYFGQSLHLQHTQSPYYWTTYLIGFHDGFDQTASCYFLRRTSSSCFRFDFWFLGCPIVHNLNTHLDCLHLGRPYTASKAEILPRSLWTSIYRNRSPCFGEYLKTSRSPVLRPGRTHYCWKHWGCQHMRLNFDCSVPLNFQKRSDSVMLELAFIASSQSTSLTMNAFWGFQITHFSSYHRSSPYEGRRPHDLFHHWIWNHCHPPPFQETSILLPRPHQSLLQTGLLFLRVYHSISPTGPSSSANSQLILPHGGLYSAISNLVQAYARNQLPAVCPQADCH